jgi:hypothetical protein
MNDVNALISLASQFGLGWAAWTYEYDGNPALVDPYLNPTGTYGTTVKNAMLSNAPIPNDPFSPIPTIVGSTTLDDSVQGSGQNQWNY